MASSKSVFLLQRAGCLFAFLMVACSLPSADSTNAGYIPFVDGTTYYKVHTTPATWGAAKATCEYEGGRLAKIDTFQKVGFIKSMAAGCKFVWTGIYRVGLGSPWYSVGHEVVGQELTYLPWAPIILLGLAPDANCVAVTGFALGFNPGLENYKCFFLKSFVCEKHVQPQTVNVQVTDEQRLNEQRLNEQRLNEQRLREQLANEQKLNEQRLNEQRLREQLANEQRLREQGLREQLANEQKLREQLANEQRLREQILNAQRLNEPKTGVQQQSGQQQSEDQLHVTKW